VAAKVVSMSLGSQTPTIGSGDFPPQSPRARFSVDEYHELIRTGMLQDGDPFDCWKESGDR
jgi:hypothetical protein